MFADEAEEVVKEVVCKNCNRCQSHGYIGCDTFRYSRESYLKGTQKGYDIGYRKAMTVRTEIESAYVKPTPERLLEELLNKGFIDEEGYKECVKMLPIK